jgi:dipeptidyl aminopeptidase/acylaminoacyl peptidase
MLAGCVHESKLAGLISPPHAGRMFFWFGNFLSLCAALLSMAGHAVAQAPTMTPVPQILSTSPDGCFLVRRAQAEPGEHGEARKSLEICNAAGEVLYSWDSGLGVTTVLWSPDNRYLAVNDMPGEQGDLVRLFSLNKSKPAVGVLRQPNGKKMIEAEQERHGSFLSAVEAVSLRAEEWRDGRLWCQLTGTSHPKRQPTVHVPFHHLLVFGVKGEEEPVLEQEWTLTEPREIPVRDPAP